MAVSRKYGLLTALTVSWRQVGTQRIQVKNFYLYIAAWHFIALVYAGCAVPS